MSLKAGVMVALALLATLPMAADVPRGWRTYNNTDYGFMIAYPQNMAFFPGHPDYKETQLSYIPICDTMTVACFEYNGKEYDDTNFQAAGLSVNILRDLKTEQGCTSIDSGSYPVKIDAINGVAFRRGMFGEAATGNLRGGPVYRAFHQNVCFEISALTAETNVGAFETPVKPFDSQKLDKLLDQMVHTFKFVGSIKDGPKWKVYNDNMCGGIYEYPENETVQTIVDYSPAKFMSDYINCARHFAHGGLDYMIATKLRLDNKNRLDSWLKASGYPDLTGARLVTTSKYCAEYDADVYYYIYCETTAYVLRVSNLKHVPISGHSDPVFTHLVNSFKAE